MDLESVLEFLRKRSDGSESWRRQELAIEYAIQARDGYKRRITDLELAIVSQFLRENRND